MPISLRSQIGNLLGTTNSDRMVFGDCPKIKIAPKDGRGNLFSTINKQYEVAFISYDQITEGVCSYMCTSLAHNMASKFINALLNHINEFVFKPEYIPLDLLMFSSTWVPHWIDQNGYTLLACNIYV